MAFKNLNHFISLLEQQGELVRIKEYVNPHLQIAEITDRVSKVNGKALLFENTGYDFPVLINAMGTEKRMAMALGVNHLDEIGAEIESLFKTMTEPMEGWMNKLKLLPQLGAIASWMPKKMKGRGACQEVIMNDPSVYKLPVLTCWPEDGGPFITLPVIQTVDPITGIRNVGLYRMQVFGPTLTGMHWHRHKVSARHFNEYKKLNKIMPIAISIGGDPAYTYAATAPLPDGVDEFMLAGFLRKKSVNMVKCISNDLYVPEDADFIIEGYVDPNEDFILEGPFGDHTGYYSLADYYPKFHITAITHKKNPIYLTTIVGIPPQEDAYIGKATERIFLAPIKMTAVPEIVDMVLPVEGVFHNLVVVKIKKDYPGQALKVMNALWGAGQMMFTKMMIVVSGDVNIHDPLLLAQEVSKHTLCQRDFVFNQGPTDVLDHSCSNMAFGGKLGIDATVKLPEELSLNDEDPIHGFSVELVNQIQNELLQFAEIVQVNLSLLLMNIPLVFIAIKKNRKGHVKQLSNDICKLKSCSNIKVFLFVEDQIDIASIADAVWRFSNNVDPKRDHILIESTINEGVYHAIFDGTRKTKLYDGFQRDWPNILVADDKTIDEVDKIWDKLNIGPFIPSPSRKYKSQTYSGGAVANDNH